MKRKLYAVLHFVPGLISAPVKQVQSRLIKSLVIATFLLLEKSSVAQTAQALDFDGFDDRVDLPFVLSGSYTKEAWIYPTDVNGYFNILSGDATALYINNGQLSAGHAQPYLEVQDPATLSINTWYHIAVTYNSGTGEMKLYKNGSQVGSTAVVTGYTETVDYIGAFYFFGPSTFYEGQIDDVRFWNYDRSAADISGSMSCNLTGDEPGLIATYDFNQGTAGGTNTGITTLNDGTDKCVPANGTLVNFALSGSSSNWVTQAGGGTGVSGTCAGSFANINLTGNSNCIVIGDNTPSTSDNTDFGMYYGPPIVRTFTINNTGNTTLNISSASLSGPGAGSFSITSAPASTVAGGGSTTIQISFFPIATGVSNATVTISNDDGDEGTFTFAITANSAVLPVELTYFKGEKANTAVKLAWQTASEQNNKGFEILRSADGSSKWESIGFVAAGKSAGVNNYSFTDRLPLKGINAYRLKQIDLDGHFKLSHIVVLNFTGNSATISVYPNPVKDKLTLLFGDNSLLNTQVKISSVTGRLISSVKLTSSRQQIDLSAMPQGIYLLSFDNGEVQRVVKQ